MYFKIKVGHMRQYQNNSGLGFSVWQLGNIIICVQKNGVRQLWYTLADIELVDLDLFLGCGFQPELQVDRYGMKYALCIQ